eukprot:TRINITY_DN2188_c0_g1_i3.p2 TRINITY_DN2188_c0_g1~~TRINITY_DN2188_c0_g1_i3.p2  ORF type:complete len:106 (-),score=22.92 TRINITY_DN2188_c0_g1_i3:18-335(-)
MVVVLKLGVLMCPENFNLRQAALAAASPDEQRVGWSALKILREQLFPLVAKLDPNNAAIIIRMLLEMDKTQGCHPTCSSDALKARVQEAIQVLHMSKSAINFRLN